MRTARGSGVQGLLLQVPGVQSEDEKADPRASLEALRQGNRKGGGKIGVNMPCANKNAGIRCPFCEAGVPTRVQTQIALSNPDGTPSGKVLVVTADNQEELQKKLDRMQGR